MRTRIAQSRCLLLALAMLPVLGVLAGSPARGDLIFLKDGFVVEGKVGREYEAVWDKGARDYIMVPKGFSFFIDDVARRVYFSHTHVAETKKSERKEELRVINKNFVLGGAGGQLPGIAAVMEPGPWDNKWERKYEFRTASGAQVKVKQRLGFLTPYHARADPTTPMKFAGVQNPWNAFYLTRELGPEAVVGLLRSHPDYNITPGLKPEDQATRRFKLCDFLAQAGWYDHAELELRQLLKDLPEQKQRTEAALAALTRMRSRENYEEIKRLHLAGQYETVWQRLTTFPQDGADQQVLAGVAGLKADYASTRKKLERARTLLDDQAARVGGGNRQAVLDMAAAIKAELSPDTLHRLETFLGQAEQARKLREQGRDKETAPAAEIMALAVSGWLLGNASAETGVERALQLWSARSLVLATQREPVQEKRRKLVDDYLKGKGVVPIDEFVQMIPTLPPFETPEKTDGKPIEVSLGGRGAGAVTYTLQLPPGYHPGRSFPVLLVLNDLGEKPREMLERWRQLAAENGYVLAAPHWEQGIANGYTYSEREHQTVLQTLYDLRRRFNVNSDRVFLFGLGQGGSMAYDVGLSHPDLFAGVIPMSGNPELFSARYLRNAQYLPFYCILGDSAGDTKKRTRSLFEAWLTRFYPTMWVEYRGRGMEWFGGEPPIIFDWMRNKKRAFPLKQLGTEGLGGPLGSEFSTMRQTDNHFYWLSTQQVMPRCLNSATAWNTATVPAMLTGKIDPATNEIRVTAKGVKQVTVWLGRNAQGQNMINFDKKVTIYVNGPAGARRPEKLTPSLATLLEVLYQTGDRQRLFLAHVDIVVSR